VFAEVVRRHEVLRTVVHGDGGQGGQARQVILPPGDFALPVIDLTAFPPAQRETVAAERVADEALRPFDLARGPLLRAWRFRLAGRAVPRPATAERRGRGLSRPPRSPGCVRCVAVVGLWRRRSWRSWASSLSCCSGFAGRTIW